MSIVAAMPSNRRSSFAKLALFFGFGDSSSAPGQPPAAPAPPSPAGPSGCVGLAFVASMSTDDVAGAKATALLNRSGGRPGGAGRKRGIPSPSPSPSPSSSLEEGLDRVPEADEQQQQRRGARTTTSAAAAVSNKRSRQQNSGEFGLGDDGDGVSGLLDLLAPPTMEEAQLVAEFLRYCSACKKELEGRDIYMYQGDKAFCSEECRHKRMELDEMTSMSRREV